MVYDEITNGDDRLADWFKEREHKGLCINASPDLLSVPKSEIDKRQAEYEKKKAAKKRKAA